MATIPNAQRGRLISSKELDSGSVSGVGRTFMKNSANSREARLSVSFPTANSPVPVYHGLGFAPTGFVTLTGNRGSGVAPGKIYGDVPLQATSKCIVLYCDTGGTVAEILVR